jgi:DNA-binding ferritin-like protein (Dps family)
MSDFFDKYLNPKKIMEGKREYKEQMARVEALPEDYRFVFKKIQGVTWMRTGGDGMAALKIQYDLIDLLEEGAADRKHILDITGDDVAAFCDELLRDVEKWEDNWKEKLNSDVLNKVGKDRS